MNKFISEFISNHKIIKTMKKLTFQQMDDFRGGGCGKFIAGLALTFTPFRVFGAVTAISEARNCARTLEKRYGCLGWCGS